LNEVTESLLFQKSAFSRNQSREDSDLDAHPGRSPKRHASIEEKSVDGSVPMRINEPPSTVVVIIEDGSTVRTTKAMTLVNSRNASVST